MYLTELEMVYIEIERISVQKLSTAALMLKWEWSILHYGHLKRT